MHRISLASPTDFEGWRKAARALRAAGISPDAVVWTTEGGPGGGPGAALPAAGQGRRFTVPPVFLHQAAKAVLHRAGDRFNLMYRVLWRLAWEPELMAQGRDPDIARLRLYEREANNALEHMRSAVRFREIRDAAGMILAAWFEPAHRVTEAAAPDFMKRYAHSRFVLLTPDRVAVWDLQTLSFGPGLPMGPADPEALTACWTGYLAGPAARRNPSPPPGVGESMAGMPPRHPSPRAARQAQRIARDGAYGMDAPLDLEDVLAQVDVCRRCELWRDATQGVAGEGPLRARLMLVGEQPGDQEDQSGRPIVGPAGQLLDKALAEAGIGRKGVYVTNAVKHFKNEPRGKRRLHKTPTAGEVSACRWWLEAERRLVKPKVIVCLGATAALGVVGKPTPVGENRGHAIDLPDGVRMVLTYHPSYLLRVPDEAARAEAYRALVSDLKLARRLVEAA